jgi:hypothetical protein
MSKYQDSLNKLSTQAKFSVMDNYDFNDRNNLQSLINEHTTLQQDIGRVLNEWKRLKECYYNEDVPQAFVEANIIKILQSLLDV